MLDEDSFLYVYRNGYIELSIPETRILAMLINKKGHAVRVEDICKAIYCDYINENLLVATISRIHRLKKKLPDEIDIVCRIGIGYKIMYKEINK